MYLVEHDGVERSYAYASVGEATYVSADGCGRAFVEPDPIAEAAGASDGILRAPLAGTVLAVHVEEGQPVEAGQLLVTVEAMKMEHRIEAPLPGVAREVTAAAGAQVAGGQQLLVIEPASSSEE